MSNAHEILVGKSVGKDRLPRMRCGADGRIILKWIVEKWDVSVNCTRVAQHWLQVSHAMVTGKLIICFHNASGWWLDHDVSSSEDFGDAGAF
jgi:hypothetical protein